MRESRAASPNFIKSGLAGGGEGWGVGVWGGVGGGRGGVAARAAGGLYRGNQLCAIKRESVVVFHTRGFQGFDKGGELIKGGAFEIEGEF